MAGERGLLMPEIRTAVRTGDTLAKDRRLMLKRPPHILVTTPESFYILLTAEKSRAILRDVETVIVDEIHAVADDKRGVHLSLSLERLEALTSGRPCASASPPPRSRSKKWRSFLAGNGPARAGHRQHRPQAHDGSWASKFPPPNWDPSLRTKCGTRSTSALSSW